MSPQFKVKHVSIIDPGAFGAIMCDGVPFAVTLERSYLEGSNQVTKILPGTYSCKRTWYIKGGYWTFEIMVPGHTRILLHKANVEDELDGCIAIGEQYGYLNGHPAILQSGAGFNEFMQKAEGLNSLDLIVE